MALRVRGRFAQYEFDETPLASTGTAELFRSTSPSGFVYKRYRRALSDRSRIDQLTQVEELGRRVLMDGAVEVGATPAASINWPIDTVAEPDSPGIRGVIVPELPARFLDRKGRARSLNSMLRPRTKPSARVRVTVLIRLAEIFECLETAGLVHGDLSGWNVVWCDAPQPAAYLIDADGLQATEPPPTAGEKLATPYWIDPRLFERQIDCHDQYSDRYGLALAMYRGLAFDPDLILKRPDKPWPQPRLPRNLDSKVRAPLERAFGRPLDPLARALPSEWVQILLSTYVRDGRFDRRQLRTLDRPGRRMRALLRKLSRRSRGTLERLGGR